MRYRNTKRYPSYSDRVTRAIDVSVYVASECIYFVGGKTSEKVSSLLSNIDTQELLDTSSEFLSRTSKTVAYIASKNIQALDIAINNQWRSREYSPLMIEKRFRPIDFNEFIKDFVHISNDSNEKKSDLSDDNFDLVNAKHVADNEAQDITAEAKNDPLSEDNFINVEDKKPDDQDLKPDMVISGSKRLWAEQILENTGRKRSYSI